MVAHNKISSEVGAKVLLHVLENVCESITAGMRALLYTQLINELDPHALMIMQFLKAKYPEDCLEITLKTPCLDTFMIVHTFLSLYKLAYDADDDVLMEGIVAVLTMAIDVMKKRNDKAVLIADELKEFFRDMIGDEDEN